METSLPEFLRNGMRVAANTTWVISTGRVPDAHKFTKSVKVFNTELSISEAPQSNASRKCDGLNPEGPAAEPLGNGSAA